MKNGLKGIKTEVLYQGVPEYCSFLVKKIVFWDMLLVIMGLRVFHCSFLAHLLLTAVAHFLRVRPAERLYYMVLISATFLKGAENG